MKPLVVAALAVVAFVPGPARATRPDTLTVVTLNLWHDQADWPRRRTTILEELRALRPDVVCLQEVLQHATLPNQAHALADSLGFHVTFASVDAESSVKRYGNAILSRQPMLRAEWKALEPKNDYRTAAHVRLEIGSRSLDVYDTHLHHTDEGGAIRTEQIRDLLAWIEATRGRGPVVLAGDFNAAPVAPELEVVRRSFVDVFAALHPGAGGEVTTLNPAKGHTPHRIDYVWISRRGKPALVPLSSDVAFDEPAADGTWASDHFGVVARFVIGR